MVYVVVHVHVIPNHCRHTQSILDRVLKGPRPVQIGPKHNGCIMATDRSVILQRLPRRWFRWQRLLLAFPFFFSPTPTTLAPPPLAPPPPPPPPYYSCSFSSLRQMSVARGNRCRIRQILTCLDLAIVPLCVSYILEAACDG